MIFCLKKFLLKNLQTLLLMDHQGNYRIILLKEIKYNLDLDPQLFHFEIPDGMEVLRGE